MKISAVAMFYTSNEKLDMWKCFLESGENESKAVLLYKQQHGLERHVPNTSIFSRLEQNLKSNGSFNKQKNINKKKIVLQAFGENPNTSIRLLSSKYIKYIELKNGYVQVICVFIIYLGQMGIS